MTDPTLTPEQRRLVAELDVLNRLAEHEQHLGLRDVSVDEDTHDEDTHDEDTTP